MFYLVNCLVQVPWNKELLNKQVQHNNWIQLYFVFTHLTTAMQAVVQPPASGGLS